jgi:hypothetical protein
VWLSWSRWRSWAIVKGRKSVPETGRRGWVEDE